MYQWYEENKKGEGRYDLVNGQYVYNENKAGMYDLRGHTGIVVAYEPANEEHEVAYVYTIEGNWNDEKEYISDKYHWINGISVDSA